MSELLVSGFLGSVEKFPNRAALEIGDETWTYVELHDLAMRVSAAIKMQENPGSYVAVLSVRHCDAYSGILGTLLAGKGYLPLHRKFPVSRIISMLEAAKCKILIVGKDSEEYFKELQPQLNDEYQIIYPDQLPDASPPPNDCVPGQLAYLLFTSGSTGVPKGVPITHANAVAYVNYVSAKYPLNENDRVSQAFDLTFDPSVHDMFTTWKAGACLCVVPESDLIAPAKFIRENELTVWYSVPSIGAMLQQMRLLRPEAFPQLRFTFFSAEALTQTLAESWQAAAPNAEIVNFYGPTEVTVNVTEYTWDPIGSTKCCLNGGVPLGWLYPHVPYLILDEHGAETSEGELYIGGEQLGSGYLNNAEKTAYHFVSIDGVSYFRTGDLIRKDEDGCLHFLGRVDDQVKVRGFRVELNEINYRIREFTKAVEVVTLPVIGVLGTTGLITFVEGPELNEAEVVTHCRKHLPDYMIPSSIRFTKKLPRNANGKVDRKLLARQISS